MLKRIADQNLLVHPNRLKKLKKTHLLPRKKENLKDFEKYPRKKLKNKIEYKKEWMLQRNLNPLRLHLILPVL